VGIEIQSFDQLDGASNQNGFPTFELSDESGLVFKQVVDRVDLNFSRQFLLYTHQNRFSKLYAQSNLKFDFISPKSPEAGHLELEANKKRTYTLALRDANANERKIEFSLQGQDLERNVTDGGAPSRAIVSYLGNILKIKAPNTPKGGLAKFFVGAHSFEMLPAYQDSQSRTYLWDMDFGIPEEIDICSEVVILNIKALIPAGQEQLFADPKVQIRFEKQTVLDDLFLRIKHSGSPSNPQLEINDGNEYLWNAMDVTWDASGFTGNVIKLV
jgi:hypothetical protein